MSEGDLLRKRLAILEEKNRVLNEKYKALKKGMVPLLLVVNVQNTNGTLVNSLLDQQDKLSKENEQLKQELESLKNAQITHNAES